MSLFSKNRQRRIFQKNAPGFACYSWSFSSFSHTADE